MTTNPYAPKFQTPPTIITIVPGSYTDQELLEYTGIAEEIRYDTYIRYGNVLLTAMFRDQDTHVRNRDLGSMGDFVNFLKLRIAYSPIAAKNGNYVKFNNYDQPLHNMGLLTLNDLTQEVLLKLYRMSPRIITLSYLSSAIKSVGIDNIRKAGSRIPSDSDIGLRPQMGAGIHNQTINTRGDEEASRLVLDPLASLEFDESLSSLDPEELAVLVGRMYNETSQDIADNMGICRRKVFHIVDRMKTKVTQGT